MHFVPSMGTTPLRLVRPDEAPEREVRPIERPLPGWFWMMAGCTVLAALIALLVWSVTADTRALRALPDDQRLAIYGRTLQNLKTICTPEAPASLRDFCHREAELAARFKECEDDPTCQQLTRPLLFQRHH